MNESRKFFLKIISNHLNSIKTQPPIFNVDYDEICAFFEKHQLNSLFYYECKDFLPEKIYCKVERLYSSEFFYYCNRKKLFETVKERFEKEKIEFFTVKGFEIARYYPTEQMRTMGDCDIIVKPEDRERAHRIMLEIGFENRTKSETEWAYIKNKIEFELHDKLLYYPIYDFKKDFEFSQKVWDFVKLTDTGYELDISYHFVYLIIHLKKHFLYSGVGFRQFADIAVLAKSEKIDWEFVKKALDDIELSEFAGLCSALCEKWFDIRMPFETKITDELFEKITQKVFEYGVFGENGDEYDIVNKLSRSGKAKTYFEILFPPYSEIKNDPDYAFVDKKPYLLPTAWLLRFIRAVKNKRLGFTAKSIKNIRNKENELSEWKLRDKK